MNEWVALTESGTTYEYRDGLVRILAPGLNTTAFGYLIKPVVMMVSTVNGEDTPLGVPWISPAQWVNSTVPVIGRRFFVGGQKDWRVSSTIVSVEEITIGEIVDEE